MRDGEGPDGAERRPPGRRARRQAEIRARLLSAGRAVFARHGVANATIAQITEAADVGFGTFYLYFRSKDALYRAIVHDGFAALGEALTTTVHDAGRTPAQWRAALRAGVDVLFQFAAANRELFLVMFAGREAEGLRAEGELRVHLATWARTLVQMAYRAECGREPARDDDRLDLVAASVVATLRRGAFWWLRRHGVVPAAEARPAEAVGAVVARFVAAGLASALCADEWGPGPRTDT
jgi:AcrR family transcriptional regulator